MALAHWLRASWSGGSTAITLICVLGPAIYLVRRLRQARKARVLQRAEEELHPILKDHTTFRSYTTQYATYPSIRTYYRPHKHQTSHDDISNLPLLVFIHGLGGVLPQFAGVLGSLTNIAPCFGLELPGHGRSTFAPKSYSAYTIEANVALWKTAIEDICKHNGHARVVLIGHSMGCSISALLASATSTCTPLSVPVSGMVSVSPRGRELSSKELKAAQQLSRAPNFLVNILRWYDRRGGEDSTSVRRVVGRSGDQALKRMQLAWNSQYRTAVLKRVTTGLLPRRGLDHQIIDAYPSKQVWSGIKAPLFLIAGQDDHVTKPEEIAYIIGSFTEKSANGGVVEAISQSENDNSAQAATNGMVPATIEATINHNVIQFIVFPSPAAHALLYAHTTYRLVSALIESFLTTHVSEKLDFAYQLRLLTTSGKWDVKNLAKWKKVLPVSAPICKIDSLYGLFRALKTMREQDDEHNPTSFLEKWAGQIYAIVDISSEPPIYDTKKLERGGVEYHKFPTVSKVPPTPLEVQDFCALVDQLVAEQEEKIEKAGSDGHRLTRKAIAVHCHYGYNRTGFFIVSYLISRKGYEVNEAIEEFAVAKPPGIRHAHFKDQLALRFAAGVSNYGKPAMKAAKQKRQQQSSDGDMMVSNSDIHEDDTGHETEGDLM